MKVRKPLFISVGDDDEVNKSPQKEQDSLDYDKLKDFLVSSSDWLKLCATLQALAWRIQKTKSHLEQMNSIIESDLLGC
jgi:hypothetical protein